MMEPLHPKVVDPKASRLYEQKAPDLNVESKYDFPNLSETCIPAQAPDLNVQNEDVFSCFPGRFATNQAPEMNVEKEVGLPDLSERSTTGQAPVLNVDNKDDFPDLSERFTTNQTFENHQELIDWVNDSGKECGAVVASKPGVSSCKKTSLSCAKYSKKHTDRTKQSSPVQLRGDYIDDMNDKRMVKVHCSQHNHQLGNMSEDPLYVCEFKPDKYKRKEAKSALIPNHSLRDKPSKKVNTRRSLADIDIEKFWGVMRPFIENVYNVPSDGHCGFRAVAAGLEMDNLRGWASVKEELTEELDNFKEEYMRIFGGEKYLKQIQKILGCTEIPCPQEFWFTLPAMGHLVASRYNVVFVCISQKHAQTFVPLRSLPPSEEPNVLAIGHVDRVHFVPIKLKPGCPIPQPVKVNVDHIPAKTWVNLLRNRSDAFRTIVGWESSVQEGGDKIDPIVIDLD